MIKRKTRRIGSLAAVILFGLAVMIFLIVLVHTSERAEEIDRERAQRARQRAEERLGKTSDTEIDRERAQAALERAMARLEAAGKTSSAQQSNRL